MPAGLFTLWTIKRSSTTHRRRLDHTMVEVFGKRWGNHSSFKVSSVDCSGFHLRVVSVMPEKSVLKYGGTIAENLFLVQVICLLVLILSYLLSWCMHRLVHIATVFSEVSAHMSLSTSTTTPIPTHSTMISESSWMIRSWTGTLRAWQSCAGTIVEASLVIRQRKFVIWPAQDGLSVSIGVLCTTLQTT